MPPGADQESQRTHRRIYDLFSLRVLMTATPMVVVQRPPSVCDVFTAHAVAAAMALGANNKKRVATASPNEDPLWMQIWIDDALRATGHPDKMAVQVEALAGVLGVAYCGVSRSASEDPLQQHAM